MRSKPFYTPPEFSETLSRFSAIRGGRVGVAQVGDIPLGCGVTGAGLSVTKAGLHTHISPNVTKRDGKNRAISCVKLHKTGRLSPIYGPYEMSDKEGRKP